MQAEPLATFLGGRPSAQRAAALAFEAHEGQERQVDGAPFAVHLLEVAVLLHEGGYPDEVVCAGLLHDAVEKGGVDAEQLLAGFGARVADIVATLTEDASIEDYEARKAALRDDAAAADDDTLAVFAADKLVKARELRIGAAGDLLMAADLAGRRRHYMASLEMLERRLPEHSFTQLLRFELDLQTRIPALSWLAPAPLPAPALAARQTSDSV